jgi:hypothetical protein
MCPDVNNPDIKLRVCAYKDHSGSEILAMSKPFRVVKYKLFITPSSLFPDIDGRYYFDYAEKLMKIAIDISDAEKHSVPNVKLRVQLDIYSREGECCTQLISQPFWSDSWWMLEDKRFRESFLDFPAAILCGIKNIIALPVCIRVSAIAVENNLISPSTIGSGQTTFFTVYAKPDSMRKKATSNSSDIGSPRDFPSTMNSSSLTSILNSINKSEEADETTTSGELNSLDASKSQVIDGANSETLPKDVKKIKNVAGVNNIVYKGPKESIRRWINLAMLALDGARRTDNSDSLDRKELFEVLAK